MTHYFDTSALGKLILPEPETAVMRVWVRTRKPVMITNIVGVVELQRAAARFSIEALERAAGLLARITLMDLTATAVQLAARLPPAQVRTLDALHIASAAELPDLTAVVTYDVRMAEAAASYGLPVVSPGKT